MVESRLKIAVHFVILHFLFLLRLKAVNTIGEYLPLCVIMSFSGKAFLQPVPLRHQMTEKPHMAEGVSTMESVCHLLPEFPSSVVVNNEPN